MAKTWKYLYNKSMNIVLDAFLQVNFSGVNYVNFTKQFSLIYTFFDNFSHGVANRCIFLLNNIPVDAWMSCRQRSPHPICPPTCPMYPQGVSRGWPGLSGSDVLQGR